jgi:hypothetical protein
METQARDTGVGTEAMAHSDSMAAAEAAIGPEGLLTGLSLTDLVSILRKYSVEFDEELLQISDCEDDIWELISGLVISSVVACADQDRVASMKQLELADCFPDSGDIVAFLLESVSYRVTQEVVDQLKELQTHAQDIVIFGASDELVKINCRAGASVVVCEEEVPDGIENNHSNRLLGIRIGKLFAKNALKGLPFGYHSYLISYDNSISSGSANRRGHVMCMSSVYNYVWAADGLTDYVYWGWGASSTPTWTDDFESSLLELLVYVNDELEVTIQSWRPMMALMMNSGMDNETTKMVDVIRRDIQSALTNTHNNKAYAIGRLHQTLSQLLDGGGNLLQLPNVFVRAANQFVEQKLKCSPREKLLELLQQSVKSAAEYVNDLDRSSSQYYRMMEFLRSLGIVSPETLAAFVAVEPTSADNALQKIPDSQILAAFKHLQPNPMEFMAAATFTPNSRAHSAVSAQYLPVLPLGAIGWSPHNNNTSNGVDVSGGVQSLDAYADYYCEVLLHDVIQIGSMLGTSLANHTVQQGAQLLMSLMNSGISYVGSSGKVMGLLNIERSMLYIAGGTAPWLDVPKSILVLPAPAPVQESKQSKKRAAEAAAAAVTPPFTMPASLLKRLRDMPRIFRNKVDPAKKLSLRVNSNFDEALKKLRLHHGADCWVDEALELVWRHMAFGVCPPQLMIFELWYGEDLVAADFGHPIFGNGHSSDEVNGISSNFGRAIYIATRFFDRDSGAAGDSTTNDAYHVRGLMPGFMLALAECNVLRKLGCELWDLGGVDMCPLMAYKYDLTGEALQRPVALAGFRDIRDRSSSDHGRNGLQVSTHCPGSSEANSEQQSIRTMAELRSGMTLIDRIDLDSLVK